MAKKAKKWYVVIVGKCPGVYDTWLNAAPHINGVPGALHESYNTEEEARRVFTHARDSGSTKVVGSGSNESDSEASSPKSSTLSREVVHSALSGRSSPRVLETPRSRRSPLPASPSAMARALQPTVLHPSATYTRGPPFSESSPNVSSRTERHTKPHVVVRTPSDISSYPSDTEELSPTSLSKSFGDSLKLETQTNEYRKYSNRPSPYTGVSPSASPLVSDQSLSPLASPLFFTPENVFDATLAQSGNHSGRVLNLGKQTTEQKSPTSSSTLPSNLFSSPHGETVTSGPYSRSAHIPDEFLSPNLVSPRACAPETLSLVPVQVVHGGHFDAPHLSSPCPTCGHTTVPVESPSMTAPGTPFDPRSPLKSLKSISSFRDR